MGGSREPLRPAHGPKGEGGKVRSDHYALREKRAGGVESENGERQLQHGRNWGQPLCWEEC